MSTKIQQKTFNRICSRLGIQTATQHNKERFNEWMRKIGNVYYSDNEQMCNAFNRID